MTRTSGYKDSGLKLVLWGQPGTYKSTFAGALGKALFIDPNGGTARLNVEREDVADWAAVKSLLDDVEAGKEDFKTIVLDEWAELENRFLTWHLRKINKPSLYYGHGKGFNEFREGVANVLRQLDRISARGTNVVVIAHSHAKTFSNPEGPDYDKYLPVADKGVWSLLFRFADAVLYFGRKVTAVEDKDGKTTAVTGESKIYCQHTALFDAKNRFNMPKSIPNGYDSADKLVRFVEGTKLLAEGKLDDLIRDNSNFKETMEENRKVQLYVHINS